MNGSFTRPSAQEIEAAVELASHAPSIHNSQPWHWRVTSRGLDLYSDPTRRLTLTDPLGRLLLVSCGAALHHVTVAMGAAHWGSQIVRLPHPHVPTLLASITFERLEPSDQLREWAQAIAVRRTDRRPMSSWPVSAEHISRLESLAAEHGVVATPLAVDQLLVWDALARRIERRRVRAEDRAELYEWTHRDPASQDGIPAANRVPVDELSTQQANRFPPGDLPLTGREDDAPDPVSLLFATTSDDVLARLRAGEALSAVLLEATRLGLATAIDTQVLESSTTRPVVEDGLLHGSRTPQLLVTVGWPNTAGRVPQTPRRPTDDILVVQRGSGPV